MRENEGTTIPSELAWLFANLIALHEGRFFGTVEVRFESGRVVHSLTAKSEKPPATPREPVRVKLGDL